jgi:hypothetical protein
LVATFLITTFALGIPFPDGSVIWPVIVARNSWARRLPAIKQIRVMSEAKLRADTAAYSLLKMVARLAKLGISLIGIQINR